MRLPFEKSHGADSQVSSVAVSIIKDFSRVPEEPYVLFHGPCEEFLRSLPEKPLFDLIVTSPPYNIGKPYEQKVELQQYKADQKKVITELVKRMKPTGSLCWQVGNYVVCSKNNRGRVYPLDILFHPIFQDLGP